MPKSKQQKEQEKRKATRREGRKYVKLTDDSVQKVYGFAQDQCEEALGLMGFGPKRIALFRQKLIFIQQVSGLYAKDDPIVVLPPSELEGLNFNVGWMDEYNAQK